MSEPSRLTTVTPVAGSNTEWRIEFTVPRHPGIGIGANLFRVYGGLEIEVDGRDSRLKLPEEAFIKVRGNAAQLRRVIDWYDELLRGWGTDVKAGFRTAPFMESAAPTVGRELD